LDKLCVPGVKSMPPVRDIIPREHLPGAESFLKEIEDRLKVSFENKKSGRPKK